jgi:pimeloyl-ACP methyl ester carboxylesterase
VKKRSLDAAYSPQELWALSYNGKTTKQSLSALQCYTDNQSNIPDLAAFVKAVQAYTGATKVDLIAHSLGITIARGMLMKHPELSQVIEDFLAIARPNHGTTVCRRMWLVWLIGWNDFMGCNELAPGSAWLRRLNGSTGKTEAHGPTRLVTIYDGTGIDIFYSRWLFLLPVGDQDSPALRGAKNVKRPGLTHDELRTNDEAVSIYLRFVQK